MKKYVVCLAAVLVSIFFLTACGASGYAKKLPGKWYPEGSSSAAFVLYDDGTCEISGEYGTGTWEVVNTNTLKLSNYYGETETGTIKILNGDKLVLSNGNRESVFYSQPQ